MKNELFEILSKPAGSLPSNGIPVENIGKRVPISPVEETGMSRETLVYGAVFISIFVAILAALLSAFT